ncbi:MAG: B12-binding domain-containing radical SAM protein [Promethearchaeota archaeon]
MKPIDVLFLHPPRIFTKDYHEVRSAFAMLPVGLVALAHYLKQHGYSTHILNIPMEIYFNKNFRLSRYLRNIDVKICAIDLHWILNAYGAIQTAKIVKNFNPNIKIVIGGFSATYFHEDVIKYPSIDVVVCGEGEIPLLQLVSHFLNGSPQMREIPNITYKKNGTIYQTPMTYIAENLNFLSFSHFELMENWKNYTKMIPSVSIMMGRSCPFKCGYCGGGKDAYYQLHKRSNVILRDPKLIVEDIHHVKNLYPKLKVIDLTHGYYPNTHQFWMNLLQLIKKENFDLGAIFEVWDLPVKDSFLQRAVTTFNVERSFLNFSVHSFSERVRKVFVTLGDPKFSFLNNDVYNLIKKCRKLYLPLVLWITVGNPYETVKDVMTNFKHILKITNEYILRYKQAILFINTAILISPSSPAFSNERKFGVDIKVKSFQDFYILFRDLRYSKGFLDDPVTYNTIYLSRRIIKILNNIFQGISLIPGLLSLINLKTYINKKFKN